MRIGIFSDTHANIEALEAVQRALTDEGVDKRVCLGDTSGISRQRNRVHLARLDCYRVRTIERFRRS